MDEQVKSPTLFVGDLEKFCRRLKARHSISMEIMNKPLQLTRASVLQRQHRHFQKLVRDVWDRSFFYRDYYASHGIKEKDLPDLTVQDLPFVSKEMLVENFDKAVLDQRLRKKELESWIDTVRDPRQFYNDDLIVLHSSGSSGKIAIFVYDRKAWHVMTTTVATHLPPPKTGRYGRTRVATYLASHGHFAGVTSSVLMPKSEYEVLILSLLDSTERVVERLNNFQPDQLSGYSSSIAMLAELAILGHLNIRPRTIIVSGDLLTPSMERRIRAAWSAPIYVVYAASESIYLGIKEPDQKEMTLIDDLNVLEILDDNHRPVAPGETGRAVLTNLYNQTLPILRYELGDYLVRGKGESDSPFATILDIHGRVNDALPVLLENGVQDSIHPHILAAFFAAGLEKVQFISRAPDHVAIRYTADRDIDSDVRQEFQHILEMKRARQTNVDVQRVRQIDVDPQTGKLRLVQIEGRERSSARFETEDHSNRPAVRSRCLDPNNPFVEFEQKDIEQSIPDRFEKQVRKYPDRIAVKGNTGVFTYQALNWYANRVARAILNAQGVCQEPVTLLLEHDSSMIAAILGVLKAGKIYVPLDSSHPEASLSRILDDTGASLIVTDEKNITRAKALAGSARRSINIDSLDSSLSDENINMPISPDAPAYILYTSGSTAQPKGVLQNHRNTLHNIMNYTNAFHVCADDRLTLLHSSSFIMSTVDIFCALLNGAAVYPFDPRAEGIVRLAKWLIQEEITIYNWTATAFRVFAGALDRKDKLVNLRLIVLGGEPVTHRDVALYENCFAPDCILVNRLGSTETGNFRLYFVNKETEINRGIVPAGYAVEDKEVLLLDASGNELGFNEVGEIAVRSRYLALGYWRQPALTDAVFLPDPKESETKRYLTGDLGLMRPDGCLEYIRTQRLSL